MPESVTARHRAGGIGRLLAVRNAVPRHAAEARFADRATVEFRVPRSRRRLLWVPAVLAVLLLAAATPLAFRGPGAPRAAVPLPTVSVAPPPAWTDPPAPTATRPRLRAVRQAAKLSPAPSPSSASPSASPSTAAPALLGPTSDADVAPLVGSYCRATHGRFSLAAATGDSWSCARLGRAGVAVDMDALCRWRYGDRARADLGRAGDARSWRCYRGAA